MGVYNIHAGHSLKCRGAKEYLDEVNEDRKVKNKVIEILRNEGHTVYDCTDDGGTTQNANLSAIVGKCNLHSVDLDVSIHLNAGGGTGTEVFYYDEIGKNIAKRISARIASELKIKDRGAKNGKHLYVLKNTKATAILVECCFVDSLTDKSVWNADKCAKAIVEGIINSNSLSASLKPPLQSGDKAGQTSAKKESGQIDCYYAAYTDRWWPEVKNREDWAGQGDNMPILYLGLRVSKGKVKGRVYTEKNGWLSYLVFENRYNTKDLIHGVFGDGSPIEAVELYYYTPEGYVYKKIHYRVSSWNNEEFYSVQIDNEKENGMDGYAGAIGKYVDKIQIWVE